MHKGGVQDSGRGNRSPWPAAKCTWRYPPLFAAASSYNAFGTEDHHVHFRLSWHFDRT